jgi:hypothetical protein
MKARNCPNPDNWSCCNELGGTGFPACAKNTLLVSNSDFTFYISLTWRKF